MQLHLNNGVVAGLAADPTADIRSTRRPLMVFKGGTLVFRRNTP